MKYAIIAAILAGCTVPADHTRTVSLPCENVHSLQSCEGGVRPEAQSKPEKSKPASKPSEHSKPEPEAHDPDYAYPDESKRGPLK